MATSSTEPPSKHLKLRYRALAYVRRFGRHRRFLQPRASSQRSFADTGGTRPVVQLGRRRSFADSGGARPMVRITSKRSFADSAGSNSGIKVVARLSNLNASEVVSTPGGIKINRRSSRTRKGVRRIRDRGKRRHRFLASLCFRLFCGCCVEQDVINPAEPSSFHWGVGFDDSYYQPSSHQRLSNGTRFRLELCGLHVTTRGKEPMGFNVDISSIGARVASFDTGLEFTCAGPVSCPPPLGLAPARQPSTTLQLLSRDGTGSGKFSGNTGFSSTGFKRKAPSSTSYPSYTPTTPPSPFMNDFLPTGTFSKTRARSRVSVGCNGRFLNDDDPSIVGWYQRRSSGEVKPPPIITHLPQVSESSRESEIEFDRELSPKRYKRSPRASVITSGVSSSSSPSAALSVMTSPKSPLVPASPASSRGSRVSIALLSQDGSISSSTGGQSWLTNREIALVPLPTSPPPRTSHLSISDTPPPTFASSRSSYSSGFAVQTYDSALGEEGDDGEPPTKRRRGTGSSSNSSSSFGVGNTSRASLDEVESPRGEENSNTSFTSRLSAILRLTRSHSPRTLQRALSPGNRRAKGPRSRSHSARRSRSMFHIGFKNKSAPPPSAPMTSIPSIVFIDCPP